MATRGPAGRGVGVAGLPNGFGVTFARTARTPRTLKRWEEHVLLRLIRRKGSANVPLTGRVQHPCSIEDLLRMPFDPRGFEDAGDLAVGVDQVADAEHAHELVPPKLFLLPQAVSLDRLEVRIGEQGMREAVFGGEFPMRLNVLRGTRDHRDADLVELGLERAELLVLEYTAAAVVLAVELDDHRMPAMPHELKGLAAVVRQGEIGGRGAGSKHGHRGSNAGGRRVFRALVPYCSRTRRTSDSHWTMIPGALSNIAKTPADHN